MKLVEEIGEDPFPWQHRHVTKKDADCEFVSDGRERERERGVGGGHTANKSGGRTLPSIESHSHSE